MFGIASIQLWFAKWAVVLLIIVGATAAGGVTGWVAKGKWVKADVVDKIVEVRKGDANAVQSAANTDARIADKTDKLYGAVKTIRDALHKPIVQSAVATGGDSTTEPMRDSGNGVPERETGGLRGDAGNAAGGFVAPVVQFCGDYRLNLRDVRLFNLAVTGVAPGAALPSDAESQVPSATTGSAFCDHYLTIIGQYEELAIDHDALVDFVEELMTKQRKSLSQ